MRRIPRSSRSIDPSKHSSHLLQPRISSSPCRAALTSCPLLRPSSATFSTSTRYNGLLSGNQDKKKHQQFVRRWQKRLLGDAEPIGAHVDPYDGSSPVRISPEEQGEELEVLDDADLDESRNQIIKVGLYEEAETGEGLLSVGGKKWIEEREEAELLERFNKLLAPTEPGYGVVKHSFGPENKVTFFPILRTKFHQAIVEVYTLKQSGLDVVLPSHAIEDGEWTRDVKVQISPIDGVVLTHARPNDVEAFLSMISNSPEAATDQSEELIIDEAEEAAAEVAEEMIGEVGAAQADTKPSSTSNKAKPKQTEGKPFDFMSNRPVPRAKQEQPIPAAEEAVGEIEETVQPPSFIETASNSVQKEISGLRHDVLLASATSSERAIAEMRKAVLGFMATQASGSSTITEPEVEAKYRNIPLTDITVKFAITKRLLQLTGVRITDPVLNASHNLADLFSAFISASKPKPTTLKAAIEYEAKIQGARSKRNKNAPGTKISHINLSSLPNVNFTNKRLTKHQEDKQLGRLKVIQYALAERGLPLTSKDA